jgi:outer membrane receptor protein involved in Fe transport
VNEDQTPIVGLGYHHEWSPGVHTLFFAARLEDSLNVTNPAFPTLVAFLQTPTGPITTVPITPTHEQYQGDLTIYSGELQQIWQTPEHNTILGTRIQYGDFDTHNFQTGPYALPIFPGPPTNAAQQQFDPQFNRISVYGYHQWQIFDPLQLIGGAAYDRLSFPENFSSAPISGTDRTVNKISPKAGLIWTPLDGTTFRFAYTRSLSGASLDQSYQLEPSQVAGFIQSYRSIIPESVVGPVPGANFETYGFSLEQKFTTGTYLGVSGNLLYSDVGQTVGAFNYYFLSPPAVPSPGLTEDLHYREESLLFTASQLVGKRWALTARYQLSQAVLNESFADLPAGVLVNSLPASQRLESVLNQVDLLAVYNHPCGFFAEGEAHWYAQNNIDDSGQPGDTFWQLNAFAGYRFLHRKAEMTLGLLNITDQNYNLNPLNLYNELPRSRTLALRLQLSF